MFREISQKLSKRFEISISHCRPSCNSRSSQWIWCTRIFSYDPPFSSFKSKISTAILINQNSKILPLNPHPIRPIKTFLLLYNDPIFPFDAHTLNSKKKWDIEKRPEWHNYSFFQNDAMYCKIIGHTYKYQSTNNIPYVHDSYTII